MCYGDSLTAGLTLHGFHPYSEYLKQELRSKGLNVDIVTIGLSGWSAEKVVEISGEERGLKTLLQTQGPFDLVILLSGTNDLGQRKKSGISKREYEIYENVWSLHEIVHKENVRTIAVAVPNSAYQFYHANASRLCDRLNNLIMNACNSVVNLCTFVAGQIVYEPASPMFEADGLHFSVIGYENMAKALLPVVMKVLKVKSPAVGDNLTK